MGYEENFSKPLQLSFRLFKNILTGKLLVVLGVYGHNVTIQSKFKTECD